ncbi:MAG: rhodanese-like domain-containing protein [Candidatus Hodarchaeales archaeon]|jgi:rhodanese-related sulfurtransferase
MRKKYSLKNQCLFLMVCCIILLTLTNHNQVKAIGMSESEIKNFLDNNPDAIILDYRWQALYVEGHLRGAYLIDSGQNFDTLVSEAIAIIENIGHGFDTPIVTYCNCETGGYASNVEDALNGFGYSNTAHLKVSFGFWLDHSEKYWATGSSRGEPYIESTFSETSSVSSSTQTKTSSKPYNLFADPIFLISLGGGGLVSVVCLIYFRQRKTGDLRKELKRTEQKKEIELTKLKNILEQKPNISKKSQKFKRRHR